MLRLNVSPCRLRCFFSQLLRHRILPCHAFLPHLPGQSSVTHLGPPLQGQLFLPVVLVLAALRASGRTPRSLVSTPVSLPRPQLVPPRPQVNQGTPLLTLSVVSCWLPGSPPPPYPSLSQPSPTSDRTSPGEVNLLVPAQTTEQVSSLPRPRVPTPPPTFAHIPHLGEVLPPPARLVEHRFPSAASPDQSGWRGPVVAVFGRHSRWAVLHTVLCYSWFSVLSPSWTIRFWKVKIRMSRVSLIPVFSPAS